MKSLDNSYQLLADTSALRLIEVSDYASEVYETLGITTTNVCHRELKRRSSNSERCRKALERLDSDSPSPNVVPTPRNFHSEDAGEKSLRALVKSAVDESRENEFKKLFILDMSARANILDDVSDCVNIVPPNGILALLLPRLEEYQEQDFCEETAAMIDSLDRHPGQDVLDYFWSVADVPCHRHLRTTLLRKYGLSWEG